MVTTVSAGSFLDKDDKTETFQERELGGVSGKTIGAAQRAGSRKKQTRRFRSFAPRESPQVESAPRSLYIYHPTISSRGHGNPQERNSKQVLLTLLTHVTQEDGKKRFCITDIFLYLWCSGGDLLCFAAPSSGLVRDNAEERVGRRINIGRQKSGVAEEEGVLLVLLTTSLFFVESQVFFFLSFFLSLGLHRGGAFYSFFFSLSLSHAQLSSAGGGGGGGPKARKAGCVLAYWLLLLALAARLVSILGKRDSLSSLRLCLPIRPLQGPPDFRLPTD